MGILVASPVSRGPVSPSSGQASLAAGFRTASMDDTHAGDAAAQPFMQDRQILQRNFERAALSFSRGDALHREIGTRMLERFEVIRLAPRRILDLGCGTGAATAGLQARFPGAGLFGLDFAIGMARAVAPPVAGWRRWWCRAPQLTAICGDMATLPFAGSTFGLVWSNLALHWLDDPAPAIREVQRVLETGGLFMFSTLGPDTLRELRAAFDTAGGGWHVKRFIDLHDIGDTLASAGFGAPVIDMEILTLTYADLDGLFADLRSTGSGNAMAGRNRALTGAARMRRVHAAYEKLRRDGRLPATFEVIYGHAWKNAPRRTGSGESVVNFAPRRK